MGKNICPFCFEELSNKDVQFRCATAVKNLDNSPACGLEPDEAYSRYKGLQKAIPRNKVFKVKSFWGVPKEGKCPSCNAVSRDRVCPSCHNTLPYSYCDTDNLIFAVIGAKETGKSHYIAVLIDYIMNTLTETFPFMLQAANDETSERYRRDFKKQVFESHVIIEATRAAATDRTVTEPLIYMLKFHNAKNKISKCVTIVFFDTAGEDLDSENTMAVENKYIYNAAGIILLLDPLQLSGVRDAVPPETALPAVNSEIESIIARTSRLIHKAKNLPVEKSIDIPLAVAFTKMDAVLPILPPSSSMKNAGTHYNQGKFDAADAEGVSAEMEALINRWAGNGFLSQVKNDFSTYAYFGLSALGCNPGDTKKIEQVVPLRVEDPFLWLLYKYKLI